MSKSSTKIATEITEDVTNVCCGATSLFAFHKKIEDKVEQYAKYRLDQFISEHFPEEVSRETTTDTLPSKFKISINYEGKELSAEEKLIAKITKKLSEELNKQRDEQIEFFKRLLRD
jgi:sulfite reductase beta subunit-like hemoprotein